MSVLGLIYLHILFQYFDFNRGGIIFVNILPFPVTKQSHKPTIRAIVTRRRWSSGHKRDPQKVPHISHWISLLDAHSASFFGGKISVYLQVHRYASFSRHWRHYVFALSVRPPTRPLARWPIDRPTDGLSVHPPRVFPGENVKEMIWNSLCWCNFTTFSTG